MPAYGEYEGKCFVCNVSYNGKLAPNRGGFCSTKCYNQYLEKKYVYGDVMKNKGLSISQWSKRFVKSIDSLHIRENIPESSMKKKNKLNSLIKTMIPFGKQLNLNKRKQK